MKLKKIIAGLSATTLALSMAIAASAASGVISAVPEGWSGEGTGLSKRILIGNEDDTPLFERSDVSKMAEITKVVVTIKDSTAGNEDFGTNGSIVITGTKTSWDQHDWHAGTHKYDEDGNLDPEVNTDVDVSDPSGDEFTITFTNDAGLFNAEDATNEENYYGIAVQSFDDTHEWEIVGLSLQDANGNEVKPSENSGTDSSEAESSTAESSSKAASTSSAAATSSKASDNTSNPSSGSAAGIALAGVAVAATAAVVVSKKKK